MSEFRKKLVLDLLDFAKSGSDEHGKLPTERKLAQLFDVSRSQLREALIALETLGVIEIRERQGIFLTKYDISEFTVALSMLRDLPQNILTQTAEARMAVETQAAVLACSRRTEEDLTDLKNCLDHLDYFHSHIDNERAQAYWNKLFHTAIVKASHNIVLLRIFEGMLNVIEKAINIVRRSIVIESDTTYAELISKQHAIIFGAIKDMDPALCERVMREHISIGLQRQMLYVTSYFMDLEDTNSIG